MIKAKSLEAQFKYDIDNNLLPQVSFIAAPEGLSEHAMAHPQDGEELVSKIIAILASNKNLYSKTVFILN